MVVTEILRTHPLFLGSILTTAVCSGFLPPSLAHHERAAINSSLRTCLPSQYFYEFFLPNSHITSRSDHSLHICFSSPGQLAWVLNVNLFTVILRNDLCLILGTTFSTVVACLELTDTEHRLCYDSKQPFRKKKAKTKLFGKKICPFCFGKGNLNVSLESFPHQKCLISLHIVWSPHEERCYKTFVCICVWC